MRQIRVDYRPSERISEQQPVRQAHSQTQRCSRHPGVHMVLAGTNHQWNTIRYVCPMCSAMGLPPVEVAAGVVSDYRPERGYGFIDSGGPRIFFHISDLQGRIVPYVGMPVTCRVEENARGLVGRQVQRR